MDRKQIIHLRSVSVLGSGSAFVPAWGIEDVEGAVVEEFHPGGDLERAFLTDGSGFRQLWDFPEVGGVFPGLPRGRSGRRG